MLCTSFLTHLTEFFHQSGLRGLITENAARLVGAEPYYRLELVSMVVAPDQQPKLLTAMYHHVLVRNQYILSKILHSKNRPRLRLRFRNTNLMERNLISRGWNVSLIAGLDLDEARPETVLAYC